MIVAFICLVYNDGKVSVGNDNIIIKKKDADNMFVTTTTTTASSSTSTSSTGNGDGITSTTETTTRIRTRTRRFVDNRIHVIEYYYNDDYDHYDNDDDNVKYRSQDRGTTTTTTTTTTTNNNSLFELSPFRIRVHVYLDQQEEEIEMIEPDFFSVTFVSYGKYTGTAQLISSPSQLKQMTKDCNRNSNNNNNNNCFMVYDWIPPFPGTYELLVHEIEDEEHFDEQQKKSSSLFILMNDKEESSSPININISSSSSSSSTTIIDHHDHDNDPSSSSSLLLPPPPCQLVSQSDIYSNWEGNWIGPDYNYHLDGGGTSSSVRSSSSNVNNNSNPNRFGWTFVPKFNCRIETFTKQDITNLLLLSKSSSSTSLTTPRRTTRTTTINTNDNENNEEEEEEKEYSIWVLGTSRERGIFLTLVDLLLNSNEKIYFQQSDIVSVYIIITVISSLFGYN